MIPLPDTELDLRSRLASVAEDFAQLDAVLLDEERAGNFPLATALRLSIWTMSLRKLLTGSAQPASLTESQLVAHDFARLRAKLEQAATEYAAPLTGRAATDTLHPRLRVVRGDLGREPADEYERRMRGQ